MQRLDFNTTWANEKQKALDEIKQWGEYGIFVKEELPRYSEIYGIPLDQLKEEVDKNLVKRYDRHWASNFAYGTLKQLFNPIEWIPESIAVSYLIFQNNFLSEISKTPIIYSAAFLTGVLAYYGLELARFLEFAYGGNIRRDGMTDIRVGLKALKLKLKTRK